MRLRNSQRNYTKEKLSDKRGELKCNVRNEKKHQPVIEVSIETGDTNSSTDALKMKNRVDLEHRHRHMIVKDYDFLMTVGEKK